MRNSPPSTLTFSTSTPARCGSRDFSRSSHAPNVPDRVTERHGRIETSASFTEILDEPLAMAAVSLAGRRRECLSAGCVGLPVAREPRQGLLRLSTVRMAEMAVFPVHDVCSIVRAMPCGGTRVAGWLVSPASASAQAALDPPDPARPALLARHELPTRPVLLAVVTSAPITSSGSMTARTGWTPRRRGARPRGEARAPTRHDVWRTATTSVLAAVRSLSPERWEARTSAMANRRRLRKSLSDHRSTVIDIRRGKES